MKNFLLLFYFFILSSNIYARVLPQDIIWNDDESGYYIIKDNSIVLVSTQGEDDKTILASSSVNNVDFKSFNFSVRKDKLLIFTNTVKVWRYETRGDYWVYDFNTRKATKIGATMPESSLMFAKFSPDGSSVAYVSKENSSSDKIRNSSTSVNIYIEDLKTNSVKQLTSSNGTKKLINGTFDWVYEEEFGCRDGFLFNDSGTKIAFWQIDANQVRDFFMINNTDSIYSYTILPGESNKFYLPRMTWLPNKDELMIQQLNRKQNHSKIFIADSESGQSRLLMEETDDAWVDLRSSWPYQVQAGWKFINNGKEFLL